MKKNNLIIAYLMSLLLLFSLFTETEMIVTAGKYALLVITSLLLIGVTSKDKKKTGFHTYNYIFSALVLISMLFTIIIEESLSVNTLILLHVAAFFGLLMSFGYKEPGRHKLPTRERAQKVRKPVTSSTSTRSRKQAAEPQNVKVKDTERKKQTAKSPGSAQKKMAVKKSTTRKKVTKTAGTTKRKQPSRKKAASKKSSKTAKKLKKTPSKRTPRTR